MNGFYREGEYWTLAFNGEVARLRASRGLLLLSRLMERPGRELHVLDLADLRGGDADRSEAVLDRTARQAFRDRIVELEADLNEADRFGDLERSALARAELDAVVDELTRATGLGGRDRRSASNSERARVAATRAIRSALERISQALPDLGRHLRHSVRTGTYCVYGPDPTRPIDWQLNAPPSEARLLHSPMPARLAIEVETSRRFVGRGPERRMLDEAWSAVPPARPLVVLIAGEPGIGKTRLVAEFAASANRDGAVVGYGRCDEELTPPYGPFSEALGHVVELAPSALLEANVAQHGAEVAAIVPALGRRVSRARDRSSAISGADRARLFRAIGSLLSDLSQQLPVILVLDDLHWADGPSLALFRHLATTDYGGRFLLVGTYRETDVSRSHPLVGLLAALRRDPSVSRVHLEGLSPDEVDELAVGAGVDGADAGALHERTGGNPFFVTEILQSIQHGHAGMPSGVRETLLHRLARLGDPAPRILRLAAVLGREFRLDVLSAVADVGIETVLDAVDQGIAAGLVAEMPDEISRFGFVHALVREALYEDLSRSRRAQLHLRAAVSVERIVPDDLRSVAHHFALSPMPAAADSAVRYSRRATERALQLYAYEEAGLLARQALRIAEAHLAGDNGLLAELLVLLGRSEIGDGRPDAGKASLRRALAIGRELESSRLLADVALAFGSLSVATTPAEIDEPVQVLREAIAARDDRDDAQHLRLLCALTRWVSFVVPRSERLELEGRALAMARRLGDDALVADALVAALYNRAGPADADAQLTMADELERLARRSRDEEKRLIAVLYRAFGLLQQGRHDLAAEAEDEFVAGTKPLSPPFFVLYSIAIAGRRACLAGDFAAAEQRATDMRNAAAQAGWDNEAPTGMQVDQQWACWYLQGRFDKLASLTSADDEPNRTVALVRSAVVALETPGATLDPQELRMIRDLMDDEGSFGWWWYLAPMLAHLCARLADRGRAQALYEKLLPWAHLDIVNEVVAFHGSVQHHLGVLAATCRNWPAAVEHFTTAIDRHNAAGSPPWVAITTAELARAIEQRNAAGDAQLCLTLRHSARETAAALGVHLHDDSAAPVRP